MSDITEPLETGMPRNVRFGIVAVLAIIVIIWLLPRSIGKPPATPAPPGASTPGKGKTQSVSDRETERRLDDILRGLSAESVAITSERLERVAELGQWAADSLTVGEPAKITIDESANAKWFSGPALTKVNNPGFSLRDAHHITLALLCGEIVTRLSQKSSDPQQQIEELFKFVVRETTLVPDQYDTQFPGTPFESLLLGRSTAASRAWAFAMLLRPLRIDVVILEPKSKPEAWVIGAIAPTGEVLLFDPRLGTAFPSAGGRIGFESAGDLATLKQHPEFLKELDLDGAPYPLNAGDLATLNVKFMGDTSSCSLRMAKLQSMVTSSRMELSDTLGANTLRDVPGLVNRITAAGAKGLWSDADVALWSYPEQQAEAFMSSGAEDSRLWKPVAEVFDGPKMLTTQRRQARNESESTTDTVVQKSDYPLRRVRVIQLQGHIAEALSRYLPIRTAARNMVNTRDEGLQAQINAAMPVNVKSADFATFWTAACQAQINPRLAADTLTQYGRDFGRGEMIAAVPELWATSLVSAGKEKEAVALLESIPKTRRSPRMEFLLKQWKTPADAPKPAAPESSPPPATPAPVPAPAATTTPAPATDDSNQPPAPPVAVPAESKTI